MRIVVCIKQVPNTNDVKINPETNALIREGVESILNPGDRYALEEALKIKDANGAEVIALSMGPPMAREVLCEAIGMGVDDAILVSDRAFAGSDTLATSYTLAGAIRKIGDVDLVICGKQAIDGDTAQVGPGISHHLGLPMVSMVNEIKGVTDKQLTVIMGMENGTDTFKMTLPGLLTIQERVNWPRVPTLKRKMKACRFETTTWTAGDIDFDREKLGLDGSPTSVVRIFSPDPDKPAEMIDGTPDEQVDRLLEIIRWRKVLS